VPPPRPAPLLLHPGTGELAAVPTAADDHRAAAALLVADRLRVGAVPLARGVTACGGVGSVVGICHAKWALD